MGWHTALDGLGSIYYWNVETGATQYEKPPDFDPSTAQHAGAYTPCVPVIDGTPVGGAWSSSGAWPWKPPVEDDDDAASLTGEGNPVTGDSERCKSCGSWMDYACEDVYVCIGCPADINDYDYDIRPDVAASEAHDQERGSSRTRPEIEVDQQRSEYIARHDEYLYSLEPRVVEAEEVATSSPCPASSASSSGVNRAPGEWPPELRSWVERSFGACRNSRDRGRCEKDLKERISTANVLSPQGQADRHALAHPHHTLHVLPMLMLNTCNTRNTHVDHCVIHALYHVTPRLWAIDWKTEPLAGKPR
tara:strand:+ start:179 stop:1093 length:915 start_codon:yes stop_codon:yes gene_type:complete